MDQRNTLLKKGERIDDLQFQGLQIIQNPSAFCFGMDAVLLTHFANVRSGDCVIDIGTGCGVIPILLSGHTKGKEFIGLELQEDMVDMARRSVELNSLSYCVTIYPFDVRSDTIMQAGGKQADVVLVNPPYYPANSVIIGENIAQSTARFEVQSTLADFVRCASALVRMHGKVCFVYPATRMLELVSLMQENNIEPKRMQFVQSKPDKPPHLILIEGQKHAKHGLKVLPTLCIHQQSGDLSAEIRTIYHSM